VPTVAICARLGSRPPRSGALPEHVALPSRVALLNPVALLNRTASPQRAACAPGHARSAQIFSKRPRGSLFSSHVGGRVSSLYARTRRVCEHVSIRASLPSDVSARAAVLPSRAARVVLPRRPGVVPVQSAPRVLRQRPAHHLRKESRCLFFSWRACGKRASGESHTSRKRLPPQQSD
jgi:hypothetical protein